MKFYLQLPKDLLFIMRITLSQLVVLIILSGVSYAGAGKAQGILNNTISIDLTSSNLQTALAEIEKSANVKFVYSRNLINIEQAVSIKADDERLSEILNSLLYERGIKYDVINNQIVLSKMKRKETLKMFNRTGPVLLSLSDIVVTGRVTDERGESLPGVSVKIKGTSLGAVTNTGGTFTLHVPAANINGTLVISYLGFATQEIPIKGQSKINIQLKEDVKALEEVVVVGYNTMRKSDVTGAVTRVGTKEIEQMPVQNALQALQGRAAGVDISSNTRPGQMGSIRIRGNRSLVASNEPLYVVDGIPLAAGGIESINPYDIESIDVLKDASSSAVYGSRAANGVVLITTKRGKNGAATISYNGISTFDRIVNYDEMFNAGEYAEYRRDAYRAYSNSSSTGYSTPYPNPIEDKRILGTDPLAWENIALGYDWEDKGNLIPKMRPATPEEKANWGVDQVPVYDGSRIPTTNWTDYVSRTGITQDHTLNVGVGSEKVSAYFSGGYLGQTGTNEGQDYKRYNGKASVDLKPNKWFTLGASINGTWSVQNYGYAGTGSRDARSIYGAARGMLPFAVPYDSSGQYIYLPGGDINIVNPILEDEYVTNERTTLRTLGSFYAEVRFTPALKYRVNFGPDFRYYRNGEFQDKRSILQGGGTATSKNFARYREEQQFAWTLDNLIYYDKIFSDVHKLGITLLQSSTYRREENYSMSARDLPYNSQKWYNLKSTAEGKLQDWGSGYNKYTLASFMARVSYSYADKYLLTASSRWDGSSVLAEGNKWDFFPSVALGWKMEQEGFLKGVRWITQLKPRIGVGITGNSAVSPYGTAGGLTYMPIVFGSQPMVGYIPSDPKASDPARMPNKELSWEKTTQWNAGVDFGFVNNRIRGYLDLYISNTSDLLMDRSISPITGYKRIYFNVGKTNNRGFDFTLSTTNVNKKSFQWNTDLSISGTKDKIVELYNGKNDAPELNFFIDEPLFVYYDFKKIGIWQNSDAAEMKLFNDNGATYKPGDIRVEDVNGDHRIDQNNDRQILGNRFPKWTGGLTNTFNYKNWELSFFIYARWGYLIEAGAVDLQGRYASRKVNYWAPDNPSNEYPRADFGNGGQPIHYSSMNYQDGAFVKVRNISIGYVVPSKLLKPMRLSNLRVYGQLLNPYLWTKNGFIDPDVYFSARAGEVPVSAGSTRSFVLGLNASF